MQHLIMEPGGTPTKPHNHPDHEEFFYIQAGEWEFTLEGDTRILRPGDVVHVPKGAMHMLRMTTHEPGMLLEVFCPVYNTDLAKDRHLFTTDAIRQRTAEAQRSAGSR
ncbi:MAG: cupin domain-containing protein [Candidatus Tectomicrobia bacterium]|nr:cupin domain-containing protein [Candidatus Tectomicrobia bacterium]